MYYCFSYRAGHMELVSDNMQQCHMTCGSAVKCEHGGNTPLLFSMICDLKILIVLGDAPYTDMQGSGLDEANVPVFWGCILGPGRE